MLLYVLKNGSCEILNETNAPCFGFSLRSILKKHHAYAVLLN